MFRYFKVVSIPSAGFFIGVRKDSPEFRDFYRFILKKNGISFN